MKRKLATLAAISSSVLMADSVNICHKTSSEKNPWIPKSVSENALPAHLAHGDFIVTGDKICPPTKPPEEPPIIPPIPPETGDPKDSKISQQCERITSQIWIANCIAVDSTKNLQTGTGFVQAHNTNELTVEVIETNALETKVLTDEIEFEPQPWSIYPVCYGKDKNGRDVAFYQLQGNDQGFALLHYLTPGTARTCELRNK